MELTVYNNLWWEAGKALKVAENWKRKGVAAIPKNYIFESRKTGKHANDTKSDRNRKTGKKARESRKRTLYSSIYTLTPHSSMASCFDVEG